MVDFEKKLNKEQLRVVYEGDGPCLVLSGPGSGKTRTLVYRTVYLLEKNIPASRILLLAFTKKAANEMLSRIHRMSSVSGKEICGGTFHHAGNLFLRRYAEKTEYSSNFIIIDEEDSKSILKSILIEQKEQGAEMPKPQVVQKIISLSTNSMKSIGDVVNKYFPYFGAEITEKIKQIADQYRTRKKSNNLMDYDDLLLNWNNMLFDSDVRREISKNFLYILIDEYQDTNPLQNEIIKKVSEINKNILAVGDDAQSIYSFRAADIGNILNFSKNYPGSKIFKLETNYRSVPEILSVANAVIANNSQKLDKELKSVKEKGRMPTVIPFSNPLEQAKFIADYIEREKERNDIAVLFRAHFQCVELEIELAKRGMPYLLRGGVRFFEQHHIKDIVAYLRIFLNLHDEASWKRILLRQDGIGEINAGKIINNVCRKETLENLFEEKGDLHKNTSSSSKKGLDEVLLLLEEGYQKNVQEKIDLFLKSFYARYLDFSFENSQERKNDIRKLKEISKKYHTLEEMLIEFSLSEEFQKDGQKKNAVVLSTVHQAKGLEWKTVFIISLKEGGFPHIKSLEEDSLEEERRLFYVAVTRCKENLFLTYPLYDYREKELSEPSRFLREARVVNGGVEEEVIYNDEINQEDGEWEMY